MMHRLRRALTAEDRRVARNWAWGVLVVYSACALTIFALVSLSQHSANGPKEAALMVLATFCMDTIVPLRGLAIASNLLFILYGIAGQLYPVLLLHAVLLPVNIVKIVRLRPQVRRVDGKQTSARRQRHGAR